MKKVIELKYKYNKLNLEHESSIRIEALAKNIGAINYQTTLSKCQKRA